MTSSLAKSKQVIGAHL